jgi:hypothetical protein
MLSTGHAVIGIYLVQITPNPWVGGMFSLGSHYLLDLIPHGDEGLGSWIKDKPNRIFLVESIDFFILGLSVWLLMIFSHNISWSTVIIGIVASTLPDFLSEFYSESKNQLAPLYPLAKHLAKFKPIYRLLGWHYRCHHFLHQLLNRPISWWFGFGYQLAITGLFIRLLI